MFEARTEKKMFSVQEREFPWLTQEEAETKGFRKDFSSFFLIIATQVGHHPSQPALQLFFIATPEGGVGGDRGVRAEPKAPPKIEDSKMEALVTIKGKEELCSKCERGPPRTCKIIFMLLLFSFCFLFRK